MEKWSSLIHPLYEWCVSQPDKTAYTFLNKENVVESNISFSELASRSYLLSKKLKEIDTDAPVILMYPQGIEFMVSFFACIFADLHPAPVHLPKRNRSNKKLREIINSSGARYVLMDDGTLSGMQALCDFKEWPDGVSYISASDLVLEKLDDGIMDEIGSIVRQNKLDDIAFLQYTSGSTAAPKGVKVTHRNCIYNLSMIQVASDANEERTYVCWMPHHHDLGLVAHLIVSMFVGAHCVILSPTNVVSKPLHWLKAISDYKATYSGAPNFAYQLCVGKITEEDARGLDLSCLRMLINAAEPISCETISAFSDKFSASGFRDEMFYPAYGMAEATVFISGGDVNAKPVFHEADWETYLRDGVSKLNLFDSNKKCVVGCGRPWLEETIKIVEPESRNEQPVNKVGEIWVSGDNIITGYWGGEYEESEVFGCLVGCDLKYFRTGDLGFIDETGELYVTGRIKDLVILNGVNYYPNDIESAVEHADENVRPGFVAAFSDTSGDRENLVIVLEVNRGAYSKNHSDGRYFEELSGTICDSIGRALDLGVSKIVFLKPGRFAKTSSGKTCRQQCKQQYLNGQLDQVFVWTSNMVRNNRAEVANVKNIEKSLNLMASMGDSHLRVFSVLTKIMSNGYGVSMIDVDVDKSIFFYGIDSINIIDIHAQMELILDKKLPTELFFKANTLLDLIDDVVAYLNGEATENDDYDLEKEIREGINYLKAVMSSGGQQVALAQTKAGSGSVFLTGASGYVGIYVLRELLKVTNVDVYCLVRAANERAGFERILKNANRYNIAFEGNSFNRRVKIVIGDVSRPYLGLDRDYYNQLANTIEKVYHCAAIDNFYFPYSLLRATNVQGTVNMVEFCLKGNKKRLTHISSCAASLLENSSVGEKSIGLVNGYAKTKFVSEKVVLGALKEGLQGEAIRLGYLYNYEEDMVDSDESLETFLSSIFIIGKVPDIDVSIDLTSVEYAAKSIVAASNFDDGKHSFTYYNPTPVEWSDVKNYIKELAPAITEIELPEFVDLFAKYVANSNSKNVKLLKSVVSPEMEVQLNTMYRAKNVDVLHEDLNICPPGDSTFARHYIDLVVKTGIDSNLRKTLVPVPASVAVDAEVS